MTPSRPAFPLLFVTDLDDTALGDGHQPYARFPDPYSEFLDGLAARGCQWAINTTWNVNGQWQLVLGSADPQVRQEAAARGGAAGQDAAGRGVLQSFAELARRNGRELPPTAGTP